MKSIYVGLTLLALASAELKPLDTTECLNVNINNIVDDFNPEISQLIVDHGLDPLVLPRIETKLWKTKFLRNPKAAKMLYKADLSLYSGILNHLSVLKRHDDVILTYKDKTITISGSFKFTSLKGEYKYILDTGIINFTGNVIIRITDLRAKINVIFDATKYSLLLDKLELETVGPIKVEIQDENGAVSWIKTAIVNFILSYFKNTIVNNIQQKTTCEIQKYFDIINSKISPKVLSQIFNVTYLRLENLCILKLNIKLENLELELNQQYTVENR